MKKIWKPFAVWATALPSNIFLWARIKLTALYVLIVILTLAVFSTAMYVSLLNNVHKEVVETADQLLRHQIYEAAVDHIQMQIMIIDLVLFVVATVGSYMLAGITLRPIRYSLEAQQAFSADASHELRTPLAVMKTDIEVLLRSKELISDSVKTILKSNLEEINSLTAMTGDLLELSRGKVTRKQPVVLTTIVQQQVEQLQSLALQKKIVLSFETKTDQLVYGDEQALARVFRNTIANALTYTPESGFVEVSVVSKKETILVTITDTGIGISEKDLPHVFKRFYKADNARSTHGTGLGLAITKTIIEQYRGTITLKSTLNKGTTVTITLPTIS